MSVSLAILILYIIALFGISWFAKKRSEGNAENYALAGRRLSAPLIAVTIIGLAVGGASTIGVSEHAFRVGLSAGGVFPDSVGRLPPATHRVLPPGKVRYVYA